MVEGCRKERGVLDDLIRALLATILVGVAPGYFWARVLRGSADSVERLTFSVALSMALVPAVALVPARFLGLGVTLPVVAFSASLVLAMGFVAYLGFGPAKTTDRALGPSPTSLGLPALVPLAAAAVLTLGAMVGAVPGGWTAPAVALLVLWAGAAHLLAFRRPEGPHHRPEKISGAPGAPAARRVLLTAVLLLALARGYAGPVLHDWPFIRGVDLYSHVVMAELMMSEGRIEPYLIYPSGFHTLTASVSSLSGLDPLEIFPVLAPALFLLPALALYVLGRRLWGWEAGVAAAFLSTLPGGTYHYYNDAMYPNLTTSHFLLALTVAALVGAYTSPSVRSGLLLAFLGSSVVLYHQVASLYLALLLVPVAVFFLPHLLARERERGVTLLLSLALLGTLSVLYAWDTYDLPGTVAGLVGGSAPSGTGTAVDMAVGSQLPYDLDTLAVAMVSHPVTLLGLAGAFLVTAEILRRRRPTPQALAHLTVLFWALLLFAGSRTTLSGFPQRFGRDLGFPLALLAAFAFVAILRSLGPRRAVAVFTASLAVLLSGTLVGLQTVHGLEEAAGPSVQLTMTPQIAAAGAWLHENNTGGNIVVSPQANQVPSRMMLAMGGYSALQSFTEVNLEFNRDLPPTGPEPLRGILWIMENPAGERTGRLLNKHDVRYLVFYKSMPDRAVVDYWRSFKARPDLYRVAFENDEVVIFARDP